ncbi:MAG: MFS transporter [Candidatus Andeanibacterium colombiense]|uniref:MFS transporter n=1 Tax=Candidatus Andeanibacterium colombiense TaxID=3121345 RepID=A0AAJ5X8H5_9SPHN|nr:MAG: MFS transporter [Sphingomonadaceae bacterium]
MAREADGVTRASVKVIAASSLGTVFEWYDFYLYGLLATIISAQFFSGVNETTAFILALAAFAAGFAVRPFGALVFGRVGDLVGRKYTFLVTMGIMGASTFTVGLLPSYATIGVAAPLLLVALRLLQGLAIGGEYGGAAIYVAEHAPEGKRGFYTSFIQTNSTAGLFAALLLVIGLRATMAPDAFADWGWRLPFLLSAVLLAISLWIRLQLAESPVFQKMKDEGATSAAPLSEAFGKWSNLRWGVIALFGAVAGQAVIWYTSQFYALFYLERVLKVDGATTNILIAIALAIGTPLYLLFGWLSDRVGRKLVIMAGLALGVVTLNPLFTALTAAANPALADAQATAPVTVAADPEYCSVQFDPVGRNKFDTTGCDVAKSALAKAGIPYADGRPKVENLLIAIETFTPPQPVRVKVGDVVLPTLAPVKPSAEEVAAFRSALTGELAKAGYPAQADPARIDYLRVIAILVALLVPVTMTYGPLAALLVELFPTRIRYTALSLPYHIGNGWFGGFLPTIAFAIVAATGNIYAGLWYPIGVAAMTLVVGLLFLPETFRRRIDHEG